MSMKNLFEQYYGMRIKNIFLLKLFLSTSAAPHNQGPDSGYCYTNTNRMTLIMLYHCSSTQKYAQIQATAVHEIRLRMTLIDPQSFQKPLEITDSLGPNSFYPSPWD